MSATEGPSPEDMARLAAVAQSSAEAATVEGTVEEKETAVQEAVKESAAQAFPELSDEQLQQLAEKLAPIVVQMSINPLSDGMIERLQELEVVFTPGTSQPAAEGTPEAAAQAEAAAAPVEVETPPVRKTWAERFAGR